jgi:hypothetical protein
MGTFGVVKTATDNTPKKWVPLDSGMTVNM